MATDTATEAPHMANRRSELHRRQQFARIQRLETAVINFVNMNRPLLHPLAWLAAFVAWASAVSGQMDVSMQCVQVNQAGNTTVAWTPPADPAGLFYQYVFHQFPANNPANISTTNMPNIAPSSVVAPGVNGNQGAVCFFVVTMATDGSSTVSDTICNTYLTATPSLTPGFADLSWNSPHIATDATGGDFTVQKADGLGNWIYLGTVPDSGGMHSFEYEVEECSEELLFRVVQADAVAACQHESNQAGSQINDELDPDAPSITDIDVDPETGFAVLNWNPSPAADLAGYIIYQCAGGSVPLDTIYDPTATNYTNLSSNAGNYIESYNVAAFDSCFVDGEPDPGAASQACASTLWISASRQPCTDAAELSWAGPYGLEGAVETYEIYAEPSTAGGAWGPAEWLGTVPAGTSEFLHEGATLGIAYRYHIEAISSTGAVSFSNTEELDFQYPGAPSYTHILRASALDSAGVEVVVDFDDNMSDQHHFILERKKANDPDAPFLRLDAVTAVGGMDVSFTDLGAHSAVLSYTYRVRVENMCNDSVDVSNEATTMLLDGTADEEQLVNTLFWNAYDNFPEAVASYRIYRSENGGNPQPLITLPASVTTYEDELDMAPESTGEFCYLVEAVDANPGPNGGVNYALSNTTCLSVPPVIWVPNAITVEGFNPVFKPVISYANLTTFRMEIYSRWGDVIFATDDIELGWDGTVNGAIVQEGAYGYTLWVQDGAGAQHVRSGLVNVLVDR